MHRRTLLAGAAALPVASLLRPRRARAAAAISDGVVKIGVLDDMSGVFADQQGMGDYIAARMAAEDFGGHVLGAPIEVVQADLQNKVDVGLAIARAWIDEEKVDAIFGLGNSAVALAVQELCQQRQRIDVPIAAGTTDLTGKRARRTASHWTYDNYSAAKGPATTLVKQGQKKWFFITSDYAFGHSLEDNATAILKGLGATVVGHSPGAARGDRLLLGLLVGGIVRRAGRRHRRGRRRLHQHRETDGRVRADSGAASCRRR